MSSKTWWDYYKEDPYEKIGRYVPNAFGEMMIIELARISWEYLDWLESVEGCDVAQFFIDNDLEYRPSDGCFHAWFEGGVSQAYLRRERKGLPRPAWCPAAHPAEYMDI